MYFIPTQACTKYPGGLASTQEPRICHHHLLVEMIRRRVAKKRQVATKYIFCNVEGSLVAMPEEQGY